MRILAKSKSLLSTCFVVGLLLALSVLLGLMSMANAQTAGIVDSGTCGNALTWTLDEDGLLTISGTGDMYDLESYGPWDNYDAFISEVIIEYGVTSIGNDAFCECTNLTRVVLPDSVISIGERAFEFCGNLTEIDLPESITTIGYKAFLGCQSLTEVTIPEGVTSINYALYKDCINITHVTLPESIISIDEDAFFDCNSLSDVFYGGSSNQWSHISIADGNSCLTDASIYYSPDIIADGICGDNLTWTLNEEGVFIIRGTGKMYDYNMGSAGEDRPWYSFRDNIKSVVIKDGVTSIGYWAFYQCGELVSVSIPNSVNDIGEFTFKACSSLKSVTIPEGVTIIGTRTFEECESLTSVSIPGTVSVIDDYAFRWCSGLKNVNYNGTEMQWNNIFVGDENDCLLNANISFKHNDTGNGVFPVEGGNIYFDQDTGEITDCDPGVIAATIPEFIDGVEIKSIGADVFSYHSALNSISIPDTVISIGSCAFEGCEHLTNVSIGSNVSSIGDSAFAYCSNLTNVIIPDSVTDLGVSAFAYCNSLTSVSIGCGLTSIEDDTFYQCRELANVVISDGVRSIGNSAFYDCRSLTNVTIPGSVTYLGESSFARCRSLSSVIIHDGVTEIGNNAFGRCRNLTEVVIPDSVTTIGDEAFQGCESLVSVNIPDGVTSIGAGTFSGCEMLSSVIIPDGVTTIGNSAFDGCESLVSVNIPDSVCSIGEYAFNFCRSLTSVSIPEGVCSIGMDAFYYCSSLTEIEVAPDNAKYSSLDGVLFNKDKTVLLAYPCGKAAGQYTIPGSVEYIEDDAFPGCENLTSIVIPDSVTVIGSNAFSGCESLNSITFGNSVTEIGAFAFAYCSSLTSVTISESINNIQAGAFAGCSNLKNIFVESGNDVYCDVDGVLFDKNKEVLIAYPGGRIGDYTVPDGIFAIWEGAFYDCRRLTGVSLPDGLEIIDWGAFHGCRSLTDITIPNSVTEIGRHAFEECRRLTSVTIPGRVNSIGEQAFLECEQLTSVTISDGVTNIGEEAFALCDQLSCVIVPESVRSIGDVAFGYSDSLIVYYVGNVDQWESISIIEDYYDYLTPKVHYNYEENHLTVTVDKDGVGWQDGELHVPYGGTAELKVIASADVGDMTYRWVKVCEGGNSGLDETLATGVIQDGMTTMEINNISQDGLYVCYVTDDFDTVRYAAICVRVDDDFSIEPVGATEYRFPIDSQPQQVTFGVSVTAEYLSDITYEWRREYFDYDEGYTSWEKSTWNRSYLITDADRTATYQCIAKRARYNYDYALSSGEIDIDYYDEDREYFYIYIDNGFSAVIESDSGTWDGQFLYLSPEDEAVLEGVTLTAVPTAYDPEGISYNWYRAGYDENGYWVRTPLHAYDGEPAITTGPVTKYYQYTCVVADKHGNYEELWFGVCVDNQFSVRAKGDTDVMVLPNESATLEVEVSAADMSGISYRWRGFNYIYDDRGGYWPGDEIIEDYPNSPVLETGPVNNCRQYLCEVTDRFGNTTWVDFEIAVDNAFSAVAHGTGSYFEEIEISPAGGDAELIVDAEANEGGIRYNWYSYKPFVDDKYGYYKPTPVATGTDIVLIDGSGANYTKTIENVTKSKWYFSRVMDEFANMIYVIFHVKVANNLTVTPVPDTSTEEEENVLVPSGSDQTLAVIASADDMEGIKYVWARGQYNEKAAFWGWADGFGKEASLELENITVPVSYRCTVTDKYDNYVSTVFNISLTYASDDGVQVQVAPGAMDDDVDFVKFVAELTQDAPAPDDAVVYDLHFEDEEGEHLQPNEDVTVSIPVPYDMDGSKCKVYYIDEENDQQLTDMQADYDEDNRVLTFTTDHFSYYAVIEEDGYTITVNDLTKGLASISNLTNDGSYSGETGFTVSCDNACAVLCTIDGQNYSRVKGSYIDDKTYSFNVDVSHEMTITVIMIGDANSDGKVNTTDVTQLKRYIAGKRSFDPVQLIAANVNDDNKINTTDVTQLKRFIAGKRDFSW